jgi:hypothetical protein
VLTAQKREEFLPQSFPILTKNAKSAKKARFGPVQESCNSGINDYKVARVYRKSEPEVAMEE